MLTWLRERFGKRGGRPRIEISPTGFTLSDSVGTYVPIQWSSITKIAAYKRDRVTTDEIVLAVEVQEQPGMVQEVSEEWTGFADLFAPMEEMVGVSPAWYRDIMVPAFEPSFRVLFERGALNAESSAGAG